MLLGVLSAALGAATHLLQRHIQSKHLKKRMLLSEELAKKSFIESYDIHINEASSDELANKILTEVKNGIIRDASEQQGITKQLVSAEVEEKMGDLKERLQAIESRLPTDSVIDKISSINDALLAQRLEQLSQRIDNLESNQLTRWDVAVTLATVMGGILIVVGATYSFLKVFGIVS